VVRGVLRLAGGDIRRLHVVSSTEAVVQNPR
jgi:hypothetical protein